MRIAVLGCGSIGQRHLRNLHALGHTDLISFDPSAATRKQISQEIGVECFPRLEEVWSRSPEVVLITAPSQFHIELALQSAENACHTFIEKPLSHSLAGVKRLHAEVEGRSLVTMVGCNMRFHPGPVTVKRLSSEGAIGRILAMRIKAGSYLPDWRPSQDYKDSYSASVKWGGAILDCIHELDLALWYGGPAKLLSAAFQPAQSIGLRTDGLAELVLGHEDGILSNVHLNFVQRDYRRTCEVIGTDGTIYWDFEKHSVEVYGPDGKMLKTVSEPRGWLVNQMYIDELSHFLSCVEARVPTVNTISNAAATLKIAVAARRRKSR